MQSNRLRVFASRRFVIPFIGAVFLAMAVIGGAALALNKASSVASDLNPPLSAEERAVIENANCAQLPHLQFGYASPDNSGGQAASAEALDRIRARRKQLHCAGKP